MPRPFEAEPEKGFPFLVLRAPSDMPEPRDALIAWKRRIRRQAEALRRAQPDKDALSRVICARFAGLPEYAAAATVMAYVGFGDEVRTRAFLCAAMAEGKRVVVPYCQGGELALFALEALDELAPGTLGIPEPKTELRSLPGRRMAPGALDLVMVPGVAFDRRGGRVGHGKGYYDRLLARLRPETLAAAVAFECQVFAEVPMGPHDVPMHRLITEKAIYPAH